ncbi:GNAT family N-acetyltransferase [Fulvivirgaceae bacterium PWU4]|uniref:GNAT family N-acetyltransferase n=1 Tax=Chryseosolibacter histidini TaxID=2782349 RepID=A0AAP2GJ83_9BACT|nr:arsenic resistance N-acetyltransferase ArsN2 [Chryseosolibacter histidini]MBT1697749.1 GNAT family N-acetyltransferase [Chryseosolibacter histidini]
MELTYRLIDDTASFEAFRSLLKASSLPADDLNYKRDLLVGYYEGDSLVGTGALEIHGNYALLRSLSVKLGIRGKSVGTTITEYLLDEARKKKLKAIYLLTETARGFFLKKGFTEVQRDEVPADVKASSEFSQVCPVTAVVMVLPIN